MEIKKDILINYKKSWNYLKDSRKFIYAIILIFVVAILFGMLIPVPPQLQEAILKFIKEILDRTKDMSHSELIGFIFLNNIQSAFFGMFLGVVFGIFSVLTTLINGYLLGYISLIAIENGGFLSLWRIFPHGIFELPSIFISLALGLKLGTFIFHKNRLDILKNYIKNSLRVFILIVIPLLVIAAIIEGTLIMLSK